jgi:uncharacterized membrane protein
MTSRAKSGWLIPTGLILLSLVPLLGAEVRLQKLVGSAPITADDARFLAAPIPIFIHIFSSATYFVLGAFQFSPSFRANHPKWHRAAGRILIPAGLLTALSGMWMATFYPPTLGSGTAIKYIRLIVGAAMIVCIGLGLAAIKRRDIARHRPWMMRAYALAIAAGTQPITLAPMLVVPASYQELTYALGMTAGWVINIAVVEWFIRRTRSIPIASQVLA